MENTSRKYIDYLREHIGEKVQAVFSTGQGSRRAVKGTLVEVFSDGFIIDNGEIVFCYLANLAYVKTNLRW